MSRATESLNTTAARPPTGLLGGLAVPDDERRGLARAWLGLGVFALIASGVFSVLLVLSRTPQVAKLMPLTDFFHVALVVHVDLSVLVWFLAFAGALWSLHGPPVLLRLGRAALALALAGTAIMVLAPFFGGGGPLMANYIPVLDEPMFLSGLAAFGLGIALLVLRTMATAVLTAGRGAAGFGLEAAVLATAIALAALVWSYVSLPRFITGKDYYELLFWGGGHALQFTYALLMLVAWLVLAQAIDAPLALPERVTKLLFVLGVGPVLLVPGVYILHDVRSGEFRGLMTWLMQFGGALPMAPFMLAAGWSCWRARRLGGRARPLHAALLASLALFSVGGVFGLLITESSTLIPAHYHGSIVGVTLALMGLAYYLLPRLGYAAPDSRAAAWQPLVYAAGQLLHIGGLAWAGGHGAQRKVADAVAGVASLEHQIAMGVMGLGGLIAIIGGLLFLIIVLRAVLAPKRCDVA
ncbi:MAG: cbb3-type cytochrome c oxidase subunit I [Betaproteobacteria bacterium]|nr:cbb3-type cytochrome c oxidase subunit I [Betaproteobacteria bacterium]